jgi:TatD DNase family protein
MLIDTHCHLDAPEFDHDRIQVIQRSIHSGVHCMVVPAVERSNFQTVIDLAAANPACAYALGIHPLYVQQAQDADLDDLRTIVATNAPVAIGEIGLDFYVEGLDRERQAFFFTEQLKIAQDADLPVILHVRKSIDDILKHLRRIAVKGGIAHAFNGSRQQADMLIEMGFKLGFGGAMTYPRALRIRELAEKLPLEAIVLETDSPDIPPEWLGHQGRNTPQELPRIAGVLAEIRGESIDKIWTATTKNAQQVLPKLAQLYTPPHVLL